MKKNLPLCDKICFDKKSMQQSVRGGGNFFCELPLFLTEFTEKPKVLF